jgi:ribosomal protein L29
MKLVDITKKNEQELATVIADLRRDLAQAHVDLRTKEVKNVKQIAGIKKSLARALTIAREREITREEQS